MTSRFDLTRNKIYKKTAQLPYSVPFFCLPYLSGSAAVETAGEKIAAAHAEADPIGLRCESTESLNLGT
jgi:hypothetical protein